MRTNASHSDGRDAGSASDETRELRERAHDLAAQILDDGYPFPRVHEWWADAAERLARDAVALSEALESSESRLVGLSADVSRLTAELDEALAANEAAKQFSYASHRRRAEEAEARVAVLREALQRIKEGWGPAQCLASDALASLRDAGEAKP